MEVIQKKLHPSVGEKKKCLESNLDVGHTRLESYSVDADGYEMILKYIKANPSCMNIIFSKTRSRSSKGATKRS